MKVYSPLNFCEWRLATLLKMWSCHLCHSGRRSFPSPENWPGSCKWSACHVRRRRWVHKRNGSRSHSGNSGRGDVAMGPLHRVQTNGTRRNHGSFCIHQSWPMPFRCSHQKCGLQHFWQWPQWGLCHHISGESWLGQNHHGWHGRADCQCSLSKDMTHAGSKSWVFSALHCSEFHCQTWHCHLAQICFFPRCWSTKVRTIPRSLPGTQAALPWVEDLVLIPVPCAWCPLANWAMPWIAQDPNPKRYVHHDPLEEPCPNVRWTTETNENLRSQSKCLVLSRSWCLRPRSTWKSQSSRKARKSDWHSTVDTSTTCWRSSKHETRFKPVVG